MAPITTSIALLAFATSALAVSIKVGLDGTPEVGRAHALIPRQDPEPTVVEPTYEEVKAANLELAARLQDGLDFLARIYEDIEKGKVQLKTKTKLSPEEHKIALEIIQQGLYDSAQVLVDLGRPLLPDEGESKGE